MNDAISVPTQEPKNKKSNMVFMSVQRPEGFIASDQTRTFPRVSNRGMQYICVFYIHYINYVKGIPIKSIKKEKLLRAYKEVYAYCESRGFRPQLQKMNNKTSRDVEDFIASKQIGQQYKPPDMHRTNSADRAIQTYKPCIKSTVTSLPRTFPIA